MRIPSNLHDEPLYGRRGRTSAKSGGIRKLIRLGAALALVVVVMRQAGRTDVYAPFFATGRGELTAATGVAETEAFGTVVDGGPWRGGDHDAFYMLLELARDETAWRRTAFTRTANRGRWSGCCRCCSNRRCIAGNACGSAARWPGSCLERRTTGGAIRTGKCGSGHTTAPSARCWRSSLRCPDRSRNWSGPR